MFIIEYVYVGIWIFTIQLFQPFCLFEVYPNKMLGGERKKMKEKITFLIMMLDQKIIIIDKINVRATGKEGFRHKMRLSEHLVSS